MKPILLFLFFLINITLAAQPGTLDNSFGTGGKVIENFSAPYVNVIDAVLQTDGKTVVLADAEYNHISHVVLVRYNTNGTLDNTFSGDGIADSPLGQATINDYPTAIKLQPDNKILVCGSRNFFPNGAFVARYNTNGTLDNTFGGTGIVYPQGTDLYEIGNLVVLPGGQIVLAGSQSSSPFSSPALCLIKLNSNGSLFTSFGTNGTVIITGTEAGSPAYNKIALQADGKLIAGGSMDNSGYSNQDKLLLARINANGTPDNSYAINGIFIYDPNTQNFHQYSDIAIQADGKIIISGTESDYQRTLFNFLIRIGTNGMLDATFGTNGEKYISTSTSGFGAFGQISLQADSKILMGGFAKNASGNYAMSVARFTTAGLLDAGFDGDGIALLPVNNYGSYGIAPVQQTDGNIIVVGYAGNAIAYGAAIGRFTAAGLADNSINAGNGITTIGSGNADEQGENVLVQPDQKIINFRNRVNGLTGGVSLTRHLPNGAADNSFGVNSRVNIDLPGYAEHIYAATLTNSKIMAVCRLQDFVKGPSVCVLRFNATGFPDSTFATNGKLIFTVNPANSNMMNRVIDAAIQPDGKVVILLIEEENQYQGSNSYIIRLNADGTYDATLNGTGKLLLTENAENGNIIVQSDGKMIRAGHVYVGPGNATKLVRLNVNGSIDNSFNSGNPVPVNFDGVTLTIQPDGKILAAHPIDGIARLNTNGSFDATFGIGGYANPGFHFGISGDSYMYMRVQADGKIILSGDDYSGSDWDYQAVRLKTNGSLDSTFGTDGIVFVPIVPGNADYARGMALQADGKILLTGFTEDSAYTISFAMIRLNNSNVGTTYTFTGSGNWDIAANWSNGAIPPATLPAGSSIIVDPPVAGICYLNTIQHISTGALLMVKAGKQLVVTGSLVLQ